MQEEIGLLDLELERRRTLEPLRFFHPNGAQLKFVNGINESESRVILFPAGNWTGKTAAAIAYLSALCWPHTAEDEAFNHATIKKWPYPKRVRIISTPKELEEIGSVQSEIKKWFPPGRYTADKCGKNYPSKFVTDSGWIIDCLTYDMAPEQFEGATISLTIMNEPPPESIFNACLARMKFGGKIIIPMTPLANSAWIWDKLISSEGKQGIRIIYGATEDNCREHNKNGVLPHAAIQALSDSCDPDDKEARLNGKFLHLAGCIFKSFKRDIHVIPPLESVPIDRNLYMVADPAVGKPIASIWACEDVNANKLTIFDEHPNFVFHGSKDLGFGVEQYKEQFVIKETAFKDREINRILDKYFGNQRRTMGGLSLKQEFANVGLDFQDSYTVGDNSAEVETGILKIKDLLRYDTTKPVSNLNQPKLQVTSNCINTIHAMERWGRNPKTGKPGEDYKDFADCVRYLAMSTLLGYRAAPDWDIKPLSYGVNNQ